MALLFRWTGKPAICAAICLCGTSALPQSARPSRRAIRRRCLLTAQPQRRMKRYRSADARAPPGAAFMYPTGVFASRSAHTIRKNAMLLPLYTLILGYAGLAAHLKLGNNNDVVPRYFMYSFPLGLPALPSPPLRLALWAAVMSVGSANLFTRNFSERLTSIRKFDPAGEAKVARSLHWCEQCGVPRTTPAGRG